MIDIHRHIHAIATLGTITPTSIGDALAVPLRKDKETRHTDIFRGGPSHDLARVTLKISRVKSSWLVSWDYASEHAPSEHQVDLTRYGRLVNMEINPHIPPEGTASYIYDHMGLKLFIEFTNSSRRLRGVALHKD